VLGWTYIPGTEFPGASGSLTAVTESGVQFPSLGVDLACGTTTVIVAPTTGCGRYVGATRTFGSAFAVNDVNVARLNLKVRLSQPLLSPVIRLTDASGQTLQYKTLPATIESLANDGWQQVSMPIKYPSTWFGGANNGVLQSGISGMTFLAGQIDLAGPAGTMQVDQIRLVQDPTYTVSINGAETLLNKGVIASADGRLSVSALYYKVSDTAAQMAADAGFGVMRIDLFWETVERNGQFDFTLFDTVLKRLEQNGMKALFILDYGHPDHGGGAPVTDEQRAAFLEYVRQATRFAQGRNVIGFEVWNEPDNSTYWTNGDPQTYSQVLKATRDAVKAIDSTRVVMNGGPSWFNLTYLQKLLATGNLSTINAFAIHGYRSKSTSPETFAGDYRRLQYLLSSRGYSMPIWMTEWGHSTAGLDTATYGDGHDIRARNWQARMVMRTVLTELGLNLPYVNLYSLLDAGTDPNHEEQNFGLLTSDLTAKPVYNAVKLFSSLTKSLNYKGLVANLPPMVHAMKWQSSASSVYAVWSESPTVTAKVSVPAAAKVTKWDGSVLSAASTASGTKTISITADSGPIYVSF